MSSAERQRAATQFRPPSSVVHQAGPTSEESQPRQLVEKVHREAVRSRCRDSGPRAAAPVSRRRSTGRRAGPTSTRRGVDDCRSLWEGPTLVRGVRAGRPRDAAVVA